MAEIPNMSPEARKAYDKALRRIEDCRLRGWVHLDLSDLGLTEVPPEIGQLSALTELRLERNRLTSLPPEVCRLFALTNLGVSGNQLTSLPPEIGRLSALSHINLQNNQFASLPSEIFQVSALRALYIGGNPFTSLPPEISKLSELTGLYISAGNLTSLPAEIGQLSALRELYLNKNQLTSLPAEIVQLSSLIMLSLIANRLASLPSEIGQLVALKHLDVAGNPLPEELLKLYKQNQLIPYLRGLASESDAAPSLFNEAKLLLVGLGEVGKTWLLKALQSEVPQPTPSTKGMEIAREPVLVPHPNVAGRELCMNAWDFGGQEHYQITHQIFFSAKAVYLLVWKPRVGVDPDLITRLERIQLSAGKSAKVLIVSTHADGIVPAVIGQEALKERFGEMIWGFYKVDSAQGPKGTGIAVLKEAIAAAAAQLEGMDTPYPKAWHAAQKAIRERKLQTMTFKDFALACGENKLDLEAAGALATIMEVQGHAVFFADAAQGAEACLNTEENLIVLDPEWLAKAVGFVLEDEPTMQQSGVLRHGHLARIWQQDEKRDCPGYDKALHGFLLWLMWRFDIAYKQSEHTSLVPELIQRNRPDNLRWTPADEVYKDRQAVLICQVVKQNPPLGMIPALTAAVHPLRKLEPAGAAKQDKLDRNWRDGFFLDTELRGEAFVELADRDLRIVVRDEYPKNLSNMIQRTLGEIVKQRWSHLNLDFRVPCMGRMEDKLCVGTFRKSWLEERRGRTVACQDCNGDIEVDLMLEGFDPRELEVMAKLNEVRSVQKEMDKAQRALMAASYGFFQQALDPARRELERAPCMLTILPESAKSWQLLSRLAEQKVRITCWCEHPDGPHPAEPIGSDAPPDYVLTFPQGWVVKAAPYIKWTSMLLKAFVPMAGNFVSESLGDDATKGLKAGLGMMNDAMSALPDGGLELNTRADIPEMYRGARPEIVALGHIHHALLDQVPPAQRWGELRPVSTKSGELLWLCAKHAAIQQPPVQQL